MTRPRLISVILGLYLLAVLVGVGSLIKRSGRPWLKMGKGQPGSVAVLEIYGPIAVSMRESAWGSAHDADDIARRLHEWSEDDDIKAIVLRINSPGGTVGAVQEIYNEVMKCKAKGKKIVASFGDVAASGGYYLGASADKIVSNPGTITGSIGVILQFGNLEGLFQKLGVRLQVVKSGEHKDIGSPARALTPEERRLLQASIDDAYEQFVDAVAKGRSMPPEKVRPLADGRIYTGRQALKEGLVDELGDRQDAIQLAIKLANLSPNARIRSDKSRSLRGLLKGMSNKGPLGFLNSWEPPSSSVSLEYALK